MKKNHQLELPSSGRLFFTAYKCPVELRGIMYMFCYFKLLPHVRSIIVSSSCFHKVTQDSSVGGSNMQSPMHPWYENRALKIWHFCHRTLFCLFFVCLHRVVNSKFKSLPKHHSSVKTGETSLFFPIYLYISLKW